jgi:hypothetical protein
MAEVTKTTRQRLGEVFVWLLAALCVLLLVGRILRQQLAEIAEAERRAKQEDVQKGKEYTDSVRDTCRDLKSRYRMQSDLSQCMDVLRARDDYDADVREAIGRANGK